MTEMGPWLLLVVEGPSEVRDAFGEPRLGIVTKLVAREFGDECAREATMIYWRHTRQVLSPLRRNKKSLRGFAAKACALAKLGQTTAYGTVLLVDNDSDNKQDRLEELQRGVRESGLTERTAVGVARQMMESWLLADPSLLGRELPAGESCETLWGKKADCESNYPKHVLKRTVLTPRSWKLHDAIEQWQPGIARERAVSLATFMDELHDLATQHTSFQGDE